MHLSKVVDVQARSHRAAGRNAYAADINDSGTIAVGAAYWDATWDYRNNYYAVRWTRASTADPWVTEDLRPKLPPNADTRSYLVNDAGTIVLLSYNTPYHRVMTSTGDVIDVGAVLEDGTVVGAVTASSKTVRNWLPVIWTLP